MIAHRELTAVDFRKVTVEGPFWGPKIDVVRNVSIPLQYAMLEETGLIDSLTPGWRPKNRWLPYYFAYETIYKWIEAASYSISSMPNRELSFAVERLVGLIGKAQQSDGYIPWSFDADDTLGARTTSEGLYCGGHLIEAAVAHLEATGEHTLLAVAEGYVRFLTGIFGTDSGKKRGYAFHPGIEKALVRLYGATGVREYANLAKYFVDERGQQPNYFDMEALERGVLPVHRWTGTHRYNQSDMPVREQSEVVGHAVMAMYLYSGMCDVSSVFDDEGLRSTLRLLWDNLTRRRMYITGGIGPASYNEGFTEDYDLPNATAYAETCASVGLVFWAHRMLQIECDRRYTDIMERALYNGVLAGISLDGAKFFYENPLTSLGNWERRIWFGCPCCPPNIARLVMSLGQYAYSQSETDAVVHLFVGGTATFLFGDESLVLRVDTPYPWEGRVAITVMTRVTSPFGIRIRIPGWCEEFTLELNGRAVGQPRLDRGYVRIERSWQIGDQIEVNFSMHSELVCARLEVLDNAGSVAIQRGPLIYCLEQADNHLPPGSSASFEKASLDDRISLDRIVLPMHTKLESSFDPALLGGIVVVTGDGAYDSGNNDELYCPTRSRFKPFGITAVPYFAWNNRQRGEMRVWVRSI